MSEKEYKEKCNNMFAKNSILLHRIDELEKQIEQMQNSVREVLASEDTEVGQLMKIVGLGWYDKKYIENLVKENEELKAKISVLLSCKNCPENNKGGYICVKEYNDQCLAQKIQYIKELEEEIEELKEQIKD